ncbi:MAG: T9SS type A sorting domain-containing protein [Bacteroidota bacterium]|nr:T9SS type A sorting domain-containing protein [Bacteroidota bacterium]
MANHIAGGEVNYKWLGDKKYEVTTKILRDCKGIALNKPLIVMYAGTDSFHLAYTRTSIKDVSENCKDSGGGPCYPQNNNNTGDGLELHTFVSYVDLDKAPYNQVNYSNICKVYFSVYDNGRVTGSIQPGPARTDIYVESMLDVCLSNYQNSSAVFSDNYTHNIKCNIGFDNTFSAFDYADYDSLSYTLVAAMNARNTPVTYYNPNKPTLPVTPYCPPNPGVVNCTPQPDLNPPRGFYFDPAIGRIVYTPVRCDEEAIVCIEVSEYRKDKNGVYRLMGSCVKDIAMFVHSSLPNFNPQILISKSRYQFKVNQNQCFNVNTFDTISGSNDYYDSITKLEVLNLPPGATFTINDLNAKRKTGEFCWKISDSLNYDKNISGTLMPITFKAFDNSCNFKSSITKTVLLDILKPDSMGYVVINTFYDFNKNGIRDNEDSYTSNQLKFKKENFVFYKRTSKNGTFVDSFEHGKYTIGIASNPLFLVTTHDTLLNIKYNDTHYLEFGFINKPGIHGRIYQDKNSNCVFDDGDIPLKGIKVSTNNQEYVGISDDDGMYYIYAPAGVYQLSCNNITSQYQVTCPNNNLINITTINDSAYLKNDFGININPDYTDLSIKTIHTNARRGSNTSVYFTIKNNGYKTRKNISLNVQLFKNSSNQNNWNTLTSKSETLFIDSIGTQSNRMIKVTYLVNADSFVSNDKITVLATIDSLNTAMDSLKSNNSNETFVIVGAPYDPNEKTIENGTQKTLFDKTINYTISFQNEGNDTAVRVIVTDTLDLKYHNLSVFNLNFSQYPCTSIIEGNIIHFIFDNINLPFKSLSGDNSIATFNFTVGLNSIHPTEQIFKNRASIYFDFEDAVITNHAVGEIVSPMRFVNIKKASSCINERNTLFYYSNIHLLDSNQVFIELSDADGKFDSTTIIGQIESSKQVDSILFHLPSQANAGQFKIRLRSTHPASISLPISGYADINIIKASNMDVTSNLSNNNLCSDKEIEVVFNNSANQYQLKMNGVIMLPFAQYLSYSNMLQAQDKIEIVMLDVNNNCKDTLHLMPNVLEAPVTLLNIVNRKMAYCENESIQLNISGADMYHIKLNDESYAVNTTQTNPVIQLMESISIQVEGMNQNGCKHLTDTLMIAVNPLPKGQILLNTNPICEKDTLIIYTINNYKRDIFKNNTIIEAASNNQVLRYNNFKQNDSFYYRAISDKNCEFKSEVLKLNVNPSPEKPVIQKSNNQLFVQSTDSITWFKDNQFLIKNTPTIEQANSGNYYVTVKNAYDCEAQSVSYLFFNSELQTYNPIHQFKVYPNPNTGLFYIENANQYHVSITSISGKLIHAIDITSDKELIDLSQLAKGLYVIKIYDNDSVYQTLISILGN